MAGGEEGEEEEVEAVVVVSCVFGESLSCLVCMAEGWFWLRRWRREERREKGGREREGKGRRQREAGK